MRTHWFAKVLQVVIVLLIVIAGFGQAVLQLWNHLMPQIFGLKPLTFWQAVGLLVLSRILIGGLRGGWGHGGYWRARMAARWERMSEEERAQFRAGLRHRCGARPWRSGHRRRAVPSPSPCVLSGTGVRGLWGRALQVGEDCSEIS